MKFAWKITWIAIGLMGIIVVAFLIWGQQFETMFSQQRCTEWFEQIRPYAWLIAIGLLAADLVLPIPATPVMAALGYIYGVPLGAAIAATGSTSSALLGYWLARLLGRRGIHRLASPAELDRFGAFFDRYGAVGIIASRAVPILPEVVSLLAGLANMTFRRFLAAVLLGTIPACVLFAYIGYAAAEQAWWAVALATAVPMVLWLLMAWLARRARPTLQTMENE